MAYFREDSWGLEREDWRMGQLCATIVNTKISKKQSPFKPSDFMPKKLKKQTQEQQINILKGLFSGKKRSHSSTVG